MNACLAHLHVQHVHTWCPRKSEGLLEHLEMEMQTVMIHHEDAQEQTQVLQGWGEQILLNQWVISPAPVSH